MMRPAGDEAKAEYEAEWRKNECSRHAEKPVSHETGDGGQGNDAKERTQKEPPPLLKGLNEGD